MLSSALLCMALNLYHECRGCGLPEQLAVYQVVKNRVRDPRYPDNACDVIYDWNHVVQFSWTGDQIDDKPDDIAAWRDVLRFVIQAERFTPPDPTRGSLCYHVDGVEGWACGPDSVLIGSHRFYYDLDR